MPSLRALTRLEKTYEVRSQWFFCSRSTGPSIRLCSEPRFIALLKKAAFDKRCEGAVFLNWFTEAFDTAELKDARAPLDQLST